MAPEATPAAPARSPRGLFLIALVAAVVGLLLTLSFGYADHDPQPHGVKLAVAAPARVREGIAQGLQRAEPGGFTVIGVPNRKAAVDRVHAQTAAGGLVVPVSGSVETVTAAATGVAQQTVITKALTAVAAKLGRSTRSLDIAVLPANDRSGLSAFVILLGILIPSLVGSVGVFLLGQRFRVWWRVGAMTVFALLAAGGAVLAMDTIFRALTGDGGALYGIAFFGAFAFVTAISALQSLLGLPGTGIAAVAFVFVGNATSGATVANDFLPTGFRQVGPWLPNSALVSATRDVIYFQSHDLAHPLLVLGLWSAAGLVLLLAVDLLHRRETRRAPRERWAEVFATPGVVHLGRWVGRRPSPYAG